MNGLSIYTGGFSHVGFHKIRSQLIWGEGYSGIDVGLPQNTFTLSAKMAFLAGVRRDPRVWINWHRNDDDWLFGQITHIDGEWVDVLAYTTETNDLILAAMQQDMPVGLGFQYEATRVNRHRDGSMTLFDVDDVWQSLTSIPAWEPSITPDPSPDAVDAFITRAKELTSGDRH